MSRGREIDAEYLAFLDRGCTSICLYLAWLLWKPAGVVKKREYGTGKRI